MTKLSQSEARILSTDQSEANESCGSWWVLEIIIILWWIRPPGGPDPLSVKINFTNIPSEDPNVHWTQLITLNWTHTQSKRKAWRRTQNSEPTPKFSNSVICPYFSKSFCSTCSGNSFQTDVICEWIFIHKQITILILLSCFKWETKQL